jgi:hypothetical protein
MTEKAVVVLPDWTALASISCCFGPLDGGPIRRQPGAAIAILAAIAVLMTSTAIAQQSVDLRGTYQQEEIKLKCEGTGGQYFEDVRFGDYGCTNEGRRQTISCSMNTLKCSLRLSDAGSAGHLQAQQRRWATPPQRLSSRASTAALLT